MTSPETQPRHLQPNIPIVHEAVAEMREAYNPKPGLPIDTDIVWVLSAPGTYLEQASPEKGEIYSSQMHDRLNIEKGFEVVREITADRLGKTPEEVTFEDIEEHGPTLYYNGEGPDTERKNYPQNEHLRKAMAKPDFPFPVSKMVIGEIDVANTPAQARDFARYLHSVKKENGETSKVAVVSLTPHAPRVSRYVQKVIEDGAMPEGVEFFGVTVAPELEVLGAGVRELRKINKYSKPKEDGSPGDVAFDPAYDSYYRPRTLEERSHLARTVGSVVTSLHQE